MDPFSKDYSSNEAVMNRKIQKIQRFIRIFTIVFVISMVIIVVYTLTNQPPTFSQKLSQKEEIFLTIKAPLFKVGDQMVEKTFEELKAEEKVYYSKFYQIGFLRYTAVIAYWNLRDVPRGTVYKSISPYKALQELETVDRYDGIVFLMENGEQEYYGKSTFRDVIETLSDQGTPAIRLKE